MLKRLKLVSASFILVCAFTGNPALSDDAPSAHTVVATVDGTEITLGHMITLRAGLPSQFAQLPPELLYGSILDQLIQHTLMMQSYEGEMPLSGRLSIENEERAIIATEVMDTVSNNALSEGAVQAAYAEKYENSADVTEFSASHILVETREEAEALVGLISDGADFAALAQEHSTGPSGPDGGQIGWFSEGVVVEPFFDAVTEMQPGDVSDPVETQFGWHVIQLDETRTKDRPELDDVRTEIREIVRQAALDAHVAKLSEKAEVDRSAGDALDPSFLDQYELLKD